MIERETLLPTLLAAAAMLIPSRTVAQVQGAAGTYRLIVCRPPGCTEQNTRNVIAAGILVLVDSELSHKQLSKAVGLKLEPVRKSEPVNGCYAIHRRGDVARSRSFVGLGGVGATRWTRSATGADSIQFGLYHTPDANYAATLALAPGDTLHGSGISVSGIIPKELWQHDTLTAVRIGPPDFKACRVKPSAVRR